MLLRKFIPGHNPPTPTLPFFSLDFSRMSRNTTQRINNAANRSHYLRDTDRLYHLCNMVWHSDGTVNIQILKWDVFPELRLKIRYKYNIMIVVKEVL